MHKIRESTLNPSIFKAYDIRGVYPSEINEDAVYAIARAFVGYLLLQKKERHALKILVTRDDRVSSPSLHTAFIDGLLDEGVSVIDGGRSTTPMNYFLINTVGADGGAMITASHNPQEFNGLKLSRAGTYAIGNGCGGEEVRNAALRGIFLSSGNPAGLSLHRVVKEDFIEPYISFFEQRFKHLKDFDVHFVADGSNGMAGLLLRKLFARFPKFHVEYLHDDIDMTFPNHEANPLNLKTLQDVQELVVRTHSSFGVSFDGDADRIGFVDEKGNIVLSDIITALFASLLNIKGEHVIYDLRSSRVVKETIREHGGIPIECRVGHTPHNQEMHKQNALLSGELSGHYYFREFFFSDSALFALFTFLDCLYRAQKPLSALVAPLQKYAKSPEINFNVKNKDRALDMIAAHFNDGAASYLDGIKIDYPDWWLNVRSSNTENLLRLNIEAATPELLDKKIKLLSELIEQSA